MPAPIGPTQTPLFGGKHVEIIAASWRAWIKLPLALLILLAPAVPVSSQPQPLPTRDTIIEEIKVYASRHVKSGSPMQTQLVVDLYRDNAVGLSRNEIARIYEEHYAQLKDASEAGSWGELLPKAGWVAAALLALLLIFRDILKDWAIKLFKAVGGRIYGRLSGYRFFYLISLRHYQRSLLKKYAELHIPFRPNRPLLMREVYVPLRVAGSSSDEQIEAYRAVAQHKRLMITGPPGSGKSMLLKHLALSYAEGRLNYLPDEPVPILLELHRLNDSSLSLEQCLVEELARNGFPHAASFVKRNLEQGVLMLLFDGLDEVNAALRGRAAQEIRDLLDKYRGCRFICTCRTAIYHDEFARAVAQTLEVVEFKDQQIRRFLRSWEPSMPEGKSIEQLMQTLSDRPRIMALARNPLLLTIIAYLYTDTNFVLPHSRAEFYEKSTDFLLDQWKNERNAFKAREKRLVLQQLALSIQDSAARGGQDRRTMEFKTVLNQVRQVLPDLSLPPDDARPLLDEIVERSGLLLAIDGGTRYSFAHLTLQEFFAAGRLRDDAAEMIGRFKADRDAWRETIKLWCGLAIDSTHLIEAVYETDPITAFECLADAQKVDQALAAKIVEEFKSHLGTKENETAIVQAFAAVAADSRPRGSAVFEFLEETLETSDPNRRLAAANALSRTNLPRAATVLAAHSPRWLELRPPLVRMGDLAVPALLKRSRQNFSVALDDLAAIGTPQAAKALAELIFGLDIALATDAAWRLAALLTHPDIEESLRDYPLDAEQRRLPRLDWVWEPFPEPAHSSLPMIAGRIAYLIDQGTPLEAPLPMSPRLAIPLCATKAEKQLNLSYLWRWEEADDHPGVGSFLEYVGLSVEKLKSKEVGNREVDIKEAINKFECVGDEFERDEFTNKFLAATSPSPSWLYLISCLRPDKKYDLLRRLIKGPMPSRADWVNIFSPVTYEFRKGWHFQFILALFAAVSLISAIGMVATIWSGQASGWPLFWIIYSLAGIILAWGLLLNFRFLGWLDGHQSIEGFLLIITAGLVAPIIALVWMIKDKQPFESLKEIILIIFLAILILVFAVLCDIPLAAIGYFTSRVILVYAPWQSLLFFWPIYLALGVVFWLIARWRHRAAQNPLSNVLEPATGSSLVVRPRGLIRLLLRKIFVPY